MAVAEIQKINILAHQSYRKEILELLYDQGFIEIITHQKEGEDQSSSPKETKANTEYELAKVKYALEFLLPYFSEKKSFIEKIAADKPTISQDEINNLKNKFDYINIAEKSENFGQRLNTIKSLIGKLEDEKKLLNHWTSLNIITETDLETATTKNLLGQVEEKKYQELQDEINKKFKEAELIKISGDNNVIYLLVIFNKKYEKDIAATLNSKEFKQIELPPLKVAPQERIKEIDNEIKEINKEIKEIEEQAKKLSDENLNSLQIIFDYLSWQFNQEQAQQNFSFTASSFSIIGWIKKRKLDKLKKELEKITKTVEVACLEIKEDESVPVAMDNPKLIKPLEFVTNIYGFPKYSEVDPTPFLAGFFILFFGLCLTDAGYGLALTIISFLALKYLKVSTEFKKLLKVLFYGGIVTFIAGALTGGWFGIVLEELPESLIWLSWPLIAIRQIDPVKDPITILILSLILGYIHLFFGSAIDLWWKIKHGEIKSGLIDSGVWLYFLLTIGLWIVSAQGIALTGLSQAALYLVYSSIALIVLTQGKSKNIIMKILGGFSALYFGITGYISDILSYSRLLALGLATGIIGMVINIIGAMLNDMIPYVGWLLMILVLIGGHIFNLIISLVGAFIHSGRLQYVEFFKTFFEGGGRKFKPFVRESKYVELRKD